MVTVAILVEDCLYIVKYSKSYLEGDKLHDAIVDKYGNDAQWSVIRLKYEEID